MVEENIRDGDIYDDENTVLDQPAGRQSKVGVGTTATVRLPSNRAVEITENDVFEASA